MKIEIRKFGEMLMSRPAGREAFLAFQAYSKPADTTEPLELDFAGVKVLAPSWADEFIGGLKNHFANPVICLPSDNSSVTASLKIIDQG